MEYLIVPLSRQFLVLYCNTNIVCLRKLRLLSKRNTEQLLFLDIELEENFPKLKNEKVLKIQLQIHPFY